MTIATELDRTGPYTSTGLGVTGYDYTFKITAEADLVVTLTSSTGAETIQTLTTHYTIAGVGDAGGGTVTFLTAPAADELVTFTRDVARTQGTDFKNRGGVQPEVIETALDKLTQIAQDLNEEVTRTIQAPVSDDLPQLDLPTAAVRASKILAFDSSGDVTTVDTDSLSIATIAAFADYQTEQFDGDGSTTVFTLAGNPGSINNTAVYIDGVRQRKTHDYTLSGQDITFVTAPWDASSETPPADTNIEVQYGQAASTFSMLDTIFTLTDDGDATKKGMFQLSGITTGTTRTLSFPDLSGIIVLTTGAQTLASKTLTNPTINSATITGTLTIDGLTVNGDNSTDINLRDGAAFHLKNQSDATKIIQFNASNITTGNTRILSAPDASGILVLNDNTVTLTNKTLTNPTITGGTFTGVMALADGSAAAPSIGFTSSVDDGLFLLAANSPAMTGQGKTVMQFLGASATAVNYAAIQNNITGNGPRLFSDGTDTDIPFQIQPKGTGGIFLDADTLNVRTRAGTPIGTFTSAGQFMLAGSSSAPSYSFTGDSNTGMYAVAADMIGLTAGGTINAIATTSSWVERVQHRGAVGSVSLPQYAFEADTNTGIYHPSADAVAIAAGATKVFEVGSHGGVMTAQFPDGTSALPGIAFISDSDTGIFLNTAGNVGISSGGVQIVNMNGGQSAFQSGSAANPGIAFLADSDTGMFRVGANSVGLAAGGVVGITLNSSLNTILAGSLSTSGHDLQTIGSMVPAIQAAATSGSGDANLAGASYSNDGNAAGINFLKSRGGTVGGSGIVLDNDIVGQIAFWIDDGTDYASPIAKVFARVNGTPGTNDAPGELVFSTVPDASITATERLRILNDGVVQVITELASLEQMVLGIPGSRHGFIAAGNDMYFNIDSDANSAADQFVWGKDRLQDTGGTELMRLEETGELLIEKTTVQLAGNVFQLATSTRNQAFMGNSAGTGYTMGRDNVATGDFMLGEVTNDADTSPTNLFNITTAGEITGPKQPSFRAHLSTNPTNKTGAGAGYTFVYDTEDHDTGGDFDGTSTFTAPVTGKYTFSVSMRIQNVDALADAIELKLVLTGGNITLMKQSNPANQVSTALGDDFTMTYAATDVVMTAADTCSVNLNVWGMAGNTVDPVGSTGESWFAGHLQVA